MRFFNSTQVLVAKYQIYAYFHLGLPYYLTAGSENTYFIDMPISHGSLYLFFRIRCYREGFKRGHYGQGETKSFAFADETFRAACVRNFVCDQY